MLYFRILFHIRSSRSSVPFLVDTLSLQNRTTITTTTNYYYYYYYYYYHSIDSTTVGGSLSVQQFYSIPVCPLPSPSNQQFLSSLGLLLPCPSTLTWVSLLVLFYMASILLFVW